MSYAIGKPPIPAPTTTIVAMKNPFCKNVRITLTMGFYQKAQENEQFKN
jgi:hypothetical protein